MFSGFVIISTLGLKSYYITILFTSDSVVCGKVKHVKRATSSNLQVTISNPQVASSNRQVTSSKPRVTSSNHELGD